MPAIDLKAFACDTLALPDWVAKFFAQSFESAQSIAILVDVGSGVIELIHGMPKVLRTLHANTTKLAAATTEDVELTRAENGILEAEERAKLAEREFAEGFPLLNESRSLLTNSLNTRYRR